VLQHLQVRDFAVVEHAELELGGGMIALTGETGAGKSIIVDALGLALGERADAGVVRYGAARAEVSASFAPESERATVIVAWLAAHDLEDAEGGCVLRRVVSREGRSRAYVNGSPVPAQSLRELADLLVDIHGQHEHQSLLRREHQRLLVDSLAGQDDLLRSVAAGYRQWRALADELQHLQSASTERADRLDLLRFQVAELEALALAEGELEQLNSEQARLAHVEELLAGAQQVVMGLYEAEEHSADQILGRCAQLLEGLGRLDSSVGPALELVRSALIQSREAGEDLRRYAADLEPDPARLREIDERLGGVHDLARKHHVAPESLPARLTELRGELAVLEGSELRGQGLAEELARVAVEYRDLARQLSAHRLRAAGELDDRVTEAMQRLGMQGGRFKVSVQAVPEAEPRPQGLDEVQFEVSANPGQPLQPLAKVASGGELARIALAIQVIAADESRVPTLVFDEVDSGIGGATAEVVGRLLRRLGERTQVLCVTHLPQVAAQAHHHFQVQKLIQGDHTRTRIGELDEATRIEEIARMLGGVELTERSVEHAREMIENAGDG
jgi:DNA repair protein RecN (Recombination protein N)